MSSSLSSSLLLLCFCPSFLVGHLVQSVHHHCVMPWGGRSLHSFHSLVTALHCPVITLGAGEGLLGLLSLFLATAGHDGTLHDCFAPQGFRGYTYAASFFRFFLLKRFSSSFLPEFYPHSGGWWWNRDLKILGYSNTANRRTRVVV